jgi:hypothetical protein
MIPTAFPSGSSMTAYRAPQKGVLRGLLSPVPGRNQVGIDLIDPLPAVYLEPEHPHAAPPAVVPVPGELDAVQVEVDPAREGGRAVMMLPLRIGVGDGQAQLPGLPS